MKTCNHCPHQPSGYRPEYARQAFVMCKLGASDAELAYAFSVNTTTIADWRATYEEFREACRNGFREGKDALTDQVERALYQRAVGYSYDKEVIKVIGRQIMRLTIRVQLPPNVRACMYWLENRRPAQWRKAGQHNAQEKQLMYPGVYAKQTIEEIDEELRRLGLAVVTGGTA